MAKKTLRNEQVQPALEAVLVLQKVKAGGLFKLKLMAIAEVLEGQLKRIEKVVKELQDEHMVKDESGKPVPRMVGGRAIEGTITFTDYAAFEAEVTKLAEGEVELEIDLIKEDELTSLPEFEGSIKGIRPLIATA